MVRVLIVDDQLPFRLAAAAVVDATDSFVVAGAVNSAEQALAEIDVLTPDLVLMDVNMPGLGGVRASRRLRRDHPDVVVVLLSSYDEAEFADVAAECGAAAYLSKVAFGPDVLAQIWSAAGKSGSS